MKEKITLATLHLATSLQVFQQVKEHLLTQGVRSRGKTGKCAYRGENNTMCAAGCLLADGEYRVVFEGLGWMTLRQHQYVPIEHLYLISKLQYIHDSTPVHSWYRHLSEIELRILQGEYNA